MQTTCLQSKGKLISEGTPDIVITEELMKEVFGLSCKVMRPCINSPFIVPMGRHHVM